MEQPYANREIKEMFETVQSTLIRIETQTTKTNGRVSDIETKRLPAIEGWKQWITGGLAAFTIMILPLFTWLLYKAATLDSIIQGAVASQLSEYDIKVTH